MLQNVERAAFEFRGGAHGFFLVLSRFSALVVANDAQGDPLTLAFQRGYVYRFYYIHRHRDFSAG